MVYLGGRNRRIWEQFFENIKIENIELIEFVAFIKNIEFIAFNENIEFVAFIENVEFIAFNENIEFFTDEISETDDSPETRLAKKCLH